ncbi:MAG: putative DNA binding domain-containing protein [Alphaproteobacteria bacterium]|nr:putative DNA binding domain-containing protein [Alphaproteobacteria bacterium]
MHIENIIKQPEGKTLEFKENVNSTDKILRTIVAFSNTAGGKIIIGIADKTKHVIGIKDPHLEEERLANLISEHISPRLVPTIEILSWKKTHLILIDVPLSHTRPHYLSKKTPDDSTYVRIGSTNRPADNDLIKSLKRSIQLKTFDEEPLYETNIEHFDFKSAQHLFSPFRSINKNDFYTLGLMIKEGARDIPTVGGVLLFSKEREKFFPDAYIKAGRFKGKDKREILDSQEIKGCLGIEDAILFFRKHLSIGINISNFHHQESWSVPQVALREALINAIVHNDYELKGTPIWISIFDDRIEIENSGLLATGLTIEDIKTGLSKIRNRVLARIFKELKLIEQWGSGIQRMIGACEEIGLKSPYFEEVIGHRFRVTFYFEKIKTAPLDVQEEHILEILKFYGPLKTHEIAKYLGLTPKTARIRLMQLINKAMIFALSQSNKDPQKRYSIMTDKNETEWDLLSSQQKIDSLNISISKAISIFEEDKKTPESLQNWRYFQLTKAISHLEGADLYSSYEVLKSAYDHRHADEYMDRKVKETKEAWNIKDYLEKATRKALKLIQIQPKP